MFEEKLDALARMMAEHKAMPFPPGFRGLDSEDQDMVMLDAAAREAALRPGRFARLVVAAVGCAVTSDPTVGGAVAKPARVRRPTDQEGQKLRQIVRRGSTGSVR